MDDHAGSSERFAALLVEAFGSRAREVAEQQLIGATAEVQIVWEQILAALVA